MRYNPYFGGVVRSSGLAGRTSYAGYDGLGKFSLKKAFKSVGKAVTKAVQTVTKPIGRAIGVSKPRRSKQPEEVVEQTYADADGKPISKAEYDAQMAAGAEPEYQDENGVKITKEEYDKRMALAMLLPPEEVTPVAPPVMGAPAGTNEDFETIEAARRARNDPGAIRADMPPPLVGVEVVRLRPGASTTGQEVFDFVWVVRSRPSSRQADASTIYQIVEVAPGTAGAMTYREADGAIRAARAQQAKLARAAAPLVSTTADIAQPVGATAPLVTATAATGATVTPPSDAPAAVAAQAAADQATTAAVVAQQKAQDLAVQAQTLAAANDPAAPAAAAAAQQASVNAQQAIVSAQQANLAAQTAASQVAAAPVAPQPYTPGEEGGAATEEGGVEEAAGPEQAPVASARAQAPAYAPPVEQVAEQVVAQAAEAYDQTAAVVAGPSSKQKTLVIAAAGIAAVGLAAWLIMRKKG